MRMRRLKVAGDSAIYHCISRTVNGEFLFQDSDREVFRKQLRQAASFCGVRILTYCILSNHFHVLVLIPKQEPAGDQELIRRYRILYPKHTRFTGRHAGGLIAMADNARASPEPAMALESILKAGGEEAEKVRRSLLRRMGDVSEFMKILKQRFSVWFNRTHGRYGTLWSERFKSVLLEGKPHALSAVAAYIDLNPVRAGLADDPKDYRFSGYGEAVGGGQQARQGICEAMGCGWARAQQSYRMLLFGVGAQAAEGAGVLDREQIARVMAAKGRLPIHEVLRCRVRYFTDGAVLGSRRFVLEQLLRYQQFTGWRKRQQQPHPIDGITDWDDLTTLRALRRLPIH